MALEFPNQLEIRNVDFWGGRKPREQGRGRTPSSSRFFWEDRKRLCSQSNTYKWTFYRETCYIRLYPSHLMLREKYKRKSHQVCRHDREPNRMPIRRKVREFVFARIHTGGADDCFFDVTLCFWRFGLRYNLNRSPENMCTRMPRKLL